MYVSKLYVLTDDILTPRESIMAQTKEVLDAGVRTLQLRDKTHSDADLLPLVKAMVALCNVYGAKLIINDRVNLALNANAHGVHIGLEDGSLEEARSLLPEAIIGVSCYGDVERAKRAQEGGASYVAFGSFFPSPTKPHTKTVPLDIIAQAKATLSIPVCVIGGINASNIHLVKDADMISVVSAAYGPHGIAQNIQDLAKGLV
ncbi:MAG: thiamine phosphate synthase [Campylobacterales bacterium]|nr:thiamine phosphate synthase [Campylobacterales bacterium]